MPKLMKMLLLIVSVSGVGQPIVAYGSIAQQDSSKVYGKIETFSKKNKFARFIYGMVFRPVAATSFKKKHHKKQQLSHGNFTGKVIRTINIVTLDPFGYSLNDTAVIPKKAVFRLGNALHVKTQYIAVKNLLLFRENDRFNIFFVNESERLIRRQYYVRNVEFQCVPVLQTVDSVDISIRVSDKWSLLPLGNPVSERTMVGFVENNFAGFGHEFQNRFYWNRSPTAKVFTSDYLIPNIRNTHITTAMHLTVDENRYYNRSIAVERLFFSPHARWAAGLNVTQLFQKDTIAGSSQRDERQNYKSNIQDSWAGYAKKILKNREEAHLTNAIVTLRYLRIRYSEKPDFLHDIVQIYSDEDLYLACFGISKRKYLKDRYIFNFGAVEDVPVGKAYGITAGYQIRNNTGRPYVGARISFGDYIELGNLSCTFEYGTFFRGLLTEQGVFSVSTRYFSNLLEIGNWKIRQFIRPQVTLGIDRRSYEHLSINDENGIRGFSSSLRGTKKIIFTNQTQSYAPWNVLGFRFGPYLICSLGMLGDTPSGFKQSPVYSQIGIGTLIRNDYLVFSNFQLSIAYYPSMPGNGFNVFKFNSFLTTDFGFRDFTMGKPEIAVFQ